MNRTWLHFLPFAAALFLHSVPLAAGGADPATDGGRVVILGFDGADANTVRELMEAQPARYPNFRKLAESGTFAPLEVVVPTESPVSWASLNSGQNPGKTGVPGFIKRSLAGTKPSPGLGFVDKKSVALEQLPDAPLPRWSPAKTAAVAGGAAFAAVLLLALVLLRNVVAASVLALLAGGGAAFAGQLVRKQLPASYPRTANVNQVESFWDHAARAGVPCVVLDAAQSFDAPTVSGAKVLHGLGLPDARNDIGQWFIYSTDPALSERDRLGKRSTSAGTIYRVDAEGGVIRTKVYGPRPFYEQERVQAELDETADAGRKDQLKDRLDWLKGSGKYAKDSTAGRLTADLVLRIEGDGARVQIGDQEQTLRVGQWSEFYELEFPLNWFVKVHAITRAKLVKVTPYVELLVNVLDIDPRKPPYWQPISSPPGFSAELAEECGLFETYGWPTLTMPFKDEKIQAETLLEDVEFTEKWREVLTHQRLAKDDWRCFMSVFSTTDRVQHMTYQFYDEDHPLHDPAAAAREMEFFGERIKLADAIPAIYRQMDRIIGDVLGKLRPDDTLMVISDHGFESFRRQVHLNNWLIENGYLAHKPLVKTGDPLKDNVDMLGFVDWTKTRVYSLGLGFLFLNLEGREPTGIVPREEAADLIEEVREKLLAARDPETGDRICSAVYLPRDVHSGDHIGLEADLIPGFKAPYRVGWSTSSGGLNVSQEDGSAVPGPSITDNDSNWSGDHVSMALDEVPGVFFSNRKVVVPEEGVRALQLAPTALALLGVPIPPEMDLPPLEFAK